MKDPSQPPAALSAEQLALFRLKLKNRREAALQTDAAPRDRQRGVYPLSIQQEQLWFVHQLEPESSVHHLHHNLTFRGKLDASVLGRCFDEIVRRHEILRTSFRMKDGKVSQFVSPHASGVMSILDLSDLSEAAQKQRIEQLTREHFHQPFDWSQGSLMRATLLRLEEEKHLLLLTLHHIITDWVSFNLLFHEVSTLYRAFSQGRPSPLEDLPVQYGDFALRQQQTLRGATLESLVAYWRTQLARAPTLLRLPTDRPRPPVQNFRGKRYYFLLPLTLYDSFNALSRRENVTLFTSLLAVYHTFLHHYTAQKEILVGTPSANRETAEFERLIGFFLNTLVLRANFSQNPTFRELLRQLRTVVVGAYAHQALPFQKLVQELQPRRSPNHMPLVQTNFIFLNYLDSAHQSSGAQESPFALPGRLRVSGAQAPIIASEFDLTLALEIKPKGIVGFFEYSIDLFDEATIKRMAAHLHNLMNAVIANPDAPVASFNIPAHQERAEAVATSRGGDESSRPELYVLNERMESAASGTSGELYIGGQQLARGYWNQPALTAERFVPHPFSRAGGARLFRTGDAARHLPDGQIEYVRK